jgi:hypothetical protein
MKRYSFSRFFLAAPLCTVLCLTASVGPAGATAIGNSSGGVSQAVAAGLVSPVTTITFNEVALADGTLLTSQYGAYDVGFSSTYYCTSCDFNQASTNDGPMAANTYSPFTTPYPVPLSVLFTSPVTAAAFATIAGGPFTLTAKLGGSMVGTLTGTNVILNSPPGTYHNFYGFYDLTFDEIEISSVGGNAFFEFDNLMVGAAVPEPTPALLLAAGLLAGLSPVVRRTPC